MSLNFGEVMGGRSTLLASYNYIDIASGTGYVNFYGTKSVLSGANVFTLIESALETGSDGHDDSVDEVSGFTTPTATTTYNFDSVEFNATRVIRGIPYVVIPVICAVPAGSGTDTSIVLQNIKLVLVKSSGNTDLTNTVNMQRVQETSSGASSINLAQLVTFNSVDDTVIKKGDKIRLTFSAAKLGVDRFGTILHNPGGGTVSVQDGGNATKTKMVVSIPFKIET